MKNKIQNEDLLLCIINVLESNGGGWLHIKPILTALETEHGVIYRSSRIVRDCIANSEGRILSNTANGYKLTRLASREERQHSEADLISRANEMLKRSDMIALEWYATHSEPQGRGRAQDAPTATVTWETLLDGVV